MHDITITDFFSNKNMIPVDVRSPKEFSEGAIPQAINIPLLNDEERHVVGTIFKQEGERKARWKAMEFVSPKLPNILAEIKKVVNSGQTPVLYCWRGGMRSKSIATFAEFAGLPSNRLIDGYKGYRKYIQAKIVELIPDKAVVIHGGTGVGKTEILHALKLKGYPVLDLEKIANHRGSVFGGLGQGEPHNQKKFDSLLYEALVSLNNNRYFFVEAESRRIGRAIQPDELLDRLINGYHIQIHASVPKRIERILADYVEPYVKEDWYQSKVKEAFSYIEKRIKNKKLNSLLVQAIEKENYYEVVRLLLEYYYDPRYQHSMKIYNGAFISVNGENINDAVSEIEQIMANKIFPKSINTSE